MNVASTIDSIIESCATHGGYVAGGLASELLRSQIDAVAATNLNRLLDEKKIDVDIFLRDQCSLHALINELRQKHVMRRFHETIRTCMFEIDNVPCQIVKTKWGEPQAVISGFDIINAHVAIDGKKVIYQETVLDLFRRSELDVSRFHRATVDRLHRYSDLKSYTIPASLLERIDARARHIALDIFDSIPVKNSVENRFKIDLMLRETAMRSFVNAHAFSRSNHASFTRSCTGWRWVFDGQRSNVLDVLRCVLSDETAFVSGGFAHDAALSWYHESADWYARYEMARPQTYSNFMSRRSNRPDIDVYFISEWDRARGTRRLLKSLCNSETIVTRTKNSTEIDTGNVIVQIVDCVQGTPERVLSTFDFRNSMVALHDGQLVVHKSVPDLMRTNTLEAGTHHSPSPYRLTKYVTEKGYRHFGPRIVKLINDCALQDDHPAFVSLADPELIDKTYRDSIRRQRAGRAR